MMILSLTPADAVFIHANQDMYPEEMREDVTIFRRLLNSGLCWGYFDSEAKGGLVGWILFEEEAESEPKRVYCYDVAVLERHQRRGIMKELCAVAYRELRWRGFEIRMHCRKASYPKPSFLWRHGYQIVKDHFIENHYEQEYNAPTLHGEHARELLLKPIGQR